MLLKSVRLENFQSHKDSTINLHPNFTVIVGAGNSGKSSTIRALSFVFYGTWDNSWVRSGEKSCRITLQTDSDCKIIREKGGGINRYIIEEPGKERQVYENFGTQVPVEIQQLLQIFKAQLDDTDTLALNISHQLDPLFLLSRTGSSKAKILGKLTGAHFLDHALREINKDKKNLAAERNVKNIELLEAQKQLDYYRNIDVQKEKLQNIDLQLQSLEQTQEAVLKLRSLHQKVKKWTERYLNACAEEDQLNAAGSLNIDSLLVQHQYILQLRQLYQKLGQNEQYITRTQVDVKQAESILQNHRQNYLKLLQQSKKCPVCHSSIDDASIHMLEEGL